MKHYFCALSILLSSYSLAGAWGVGSFENDSALDWVYQLENATSASFLNDTFRDIKGRKYVEVDECATALAAAEVVASINEKSLSHLPSEVQAWIKKYSIEVDQSLKVGAAFAVSSCSDSKISELAQLWGESANSEWFSYISKLQSRLK